MWDYKIFQFHGLPRVECHLEKASIKSWMSLNWAFSKCNSALYIKDAISLFLIFIHSLRKRSILINEERGVSIQHLISSTVSWVISMICSFSLEKSLSICSSFNVKGITLSIRSKNGRSRYPRNVFETNHLLLQEYFPSLMMDSTISQILSHVSIIT